MALQFRTHKPSWQSQAAHFSKVPRSENDSLCTTATCYLDYCEDSSREGELYWGMNFKPGLKVRGGEGRIEQY